MIVDPRTLAADLEEEALEWGSEDPIVPKLHAACHLLRGVLAPLHDAWLQAKPPCPNSDCVDGWEDDFDDSTKRERCDRCPESPGVQPFDKWTAGLVARDSLRCPHCGYREHAPHAGCAGRQIGGTR